MTTKSQTGKFYACRLYQIKFRPADPINDWKEEIIYLRTNHLAAYKVRGWLANPIAGLMYAFVGMKT